MASVENSVINWEIRVSESTELTLGICRSFSRIFLSLFDQLASYYILLRKSTSDPSIFLDNVVLIDPRKSPPVE
jgi:hypothetical protein